jgi:hypothetical protein
MTEEHFTALLSAAEAKKDDQGFMLPSHGKTWSLYVASGAAGLNVTRIEALRVDKSLLRARTVKGELYILALEDVYAGAVDAGVSSSRKAGFG